MYCTATDVLSCADAQHASAQERFTNFLPQTPTCMQMRHAVLEQKRKSVWKGVRSSNFGSAAAAQMGSQWKGVCELRFLRFPWGWGSMPGFTGLCARMCAPGMCTVLELKDKGWRWGGEGGCLNVERNYRCAGLWAEEHVFECLDKGQQQSQDIALQKEWNMVLVVLL